MNTDEIFEQIKKNVRSWTDEIKPPHISTDIDDIGPHSARKIIDKNLHDLQKTAEKATKTKEFVFSRHPIRRFFGLKNEAMRKAEAAQESAKNDYKTADKNYGKDLRELAGKRNFENQIWRKQVLQPIKDQQKAALELINSPHQEVRDRIEVDFVLGARFSTFKEFVDAAKIQIACDKREKERHAEMQPKPEHEQDHTYSGPAAPSPF